LKLQKIIEGLIYGLGAAFVFGVFSKLPLEFKSFPEVKIYLIDLIIFSLFWLWIFWHLANKKKFLLPSKLSSTKILMGAFLISILLNFGRFGISSSVIGFFYFARWFFYFGIYLLIFDLVKQKTDISKIKPGKVFLILGATLSLTGLAQYLFLPDTRFLLSAGWDEHYFRIIGSFLDPNFMGIILVFLIQGIVVDYLFSPFEFKKRPEDWLKTGTLISRTVAFMLTYSRSSYLAFLSGIFIVFLFLKKPRLIFWLLFWFCLSLFFLPRPGGEGVKLERTASVNQRIISWKQALTVWKQSPVFGVGFNNYRYAAINNLNLKNEQFQLSHSGAGVENSFLLVLATSGVLGLAAFLYFWKSFLIKIFNFKSPQAKLLCLSWTISALINCQFLNSLFYPWVMVWLFFWLGYFSGLEKNY